MMTDEQINRLCEQELQNALERIRAVGPDRVVINRAGLAVPATDAAANNVAPDVVFVRNDGWSLGAPATLERVAHQLWARYWIAKFNVGTGEIVRFEEVPF